MDDLIKSVEDKKTKLSGKALLLEGMSGMLVRILLNELCAPPESRYLEIGTHMGSTLISAMYGNSVYAVAVDNFSQPFGQDSPKRRLMQHLGMFDLACTIVERDYTDPDVPSLCGSDFTVLFVDGYHSLEHTQLIIERFYTCMARRFTMVIDDWSQGNCKPVQDGYARARETLGWLSVFRRELHSEKMSDRAGWWNGLLVEVCEKP